MEPKSYIPHLGTVRPLSDRILIKIDRPETTSRGGIIIPDKTKERPTKGTVLATGPGKLNPETGVRVPLMVKPGDRVLFLKWGGDKVSETGDGDFTLLPEGDILAVLGEEES